MTAQPRRVFDVVSLGTMGYADALTLQRAAAQARIDGGLSHDVLLLVEHPPVITLGRSTDGAHLLADSGMLAERGVGVHEVERGGDITFHGPGQLVGYPIVDLRGHREDLHWYLRRLEDVIIRALATFGIDAERREKLTGVWTGGRKIASIGVHARQWVTWHGFALNVSTDLSYFDLIVPCGIDNVVMTSIARELAGRGAAPEALGKDAERAVVQAFGATFDLAPVPTTADAFRAQLLEATER